MTTHKHANEAENEVLTLDKNKRRQTTSLNQQDDS